MFTNIKQKEFLELSTKENTVVLDVRTNAEFKSGSLPNAINVEIMSSEFHAKLSKLEKSKTYLVYCRSGVRSTSTCFSMMGMGFDKIYNLEGGLVKWE